MQEWARDYFCDWVKDLSIEPEMDDDEIDELIREYINDHGILIEFEGSMVEGRIIVSAF